ncbi:hypothetical protein F4804DRAFT_354326 [Jackrogersella minutella]|nr:hypothetical protein F4804DRAFT_354326 [Jackrogersella minutella]
MAAAFADNGDTGDECARLGTLTLRDSTEETQAYYGRNSNLEDLVQNHRDGLGKSSSDLFNITHLEHYVETMYGFLQHEALKLAHEKREAENTQIHHNSSEHQYASITVIPGVKREITDIEDRIKELKERLALEAPEFGDNLDHDERQKIESYRGHLARAVLGTLRGDYRQALETLKYVERRFMSCFTAEHIKRLEISSFRALLLALNWKIYEAERLCRRTISMMAEEKGPQHPMRLVTMSNLVYILLEQRDLRAALETAESVVTETIEALGDHHPLTLHCKAQLALTKFHCGDYSRAEAELESTIRVFKNLSRRNQPDLLQYQSILAKVYLKMGKPGAAERLMVTALDVKLELSPLADSEAFNEVTQAEVPKNKLGTFLRNFIQGWETASLSRKLDPHFLDGLKVYAEVLYAQSQENFAISIYRAVWAQEQAQMGKTYLNTATSLYRLSIMEWGFRRDIKTYEAVREQLTEVVNIRKWILDWTHVETASARRELLKIEYDMKTGDDAGTSSNDNKNKLDHATWDRLKTESELIYDTHVSNYWKRHPETLKSLLWILKLRLSNNLNQKTEVTSNVLLSTLRLPAVQECCLFESLNMQFCVALAYLDSSCYHHAGEILRHIVQVVGVSLSTQDQEMHNSLRHVRTEALYLLGKLNALI